MNSLKYTHSKLIVKLIVKNALFCSVRDSTSSRNLQKYNFYKDKLYTLSDLVFSEISDLEKGQISKKIIGINLRYFTKKHYNNETINKYNLEMSKFLEYLINKYDCHLLFIPFCKEPHQNDLLALDKLSLSKECKEQYLSISKWNNFKELNSEYLKCSNFIGVRFHSNCLALKANIPLMAISYDEKTDNLMNDINMDKFCLHIPEVSFDKLKYIWNYCEKNRDEIIKHEAVVTKELYLKSRNHFNLLKKYI